MNARKIIVPVVICSIVLGFYAITTYARTATEHPTFSNLIHREPVGSLKVKYIKLPSAPVRETVKVDRTQTECMALNMYFEARNQKSDDAMVAVGYAVLNRVASKHYPNSICKVVFQGYRDQSGNYEHNRCQFSWVCDGKPDHPNLSHSVEVNAWNRAKTAAVHVILGDAPNPVGNAIMYHASYVTPKWAKSYMMVTQIQDHIFYEANTQGI